jgi:hypothetical protein
MDHFILKRAFIIIIFLLIGLSLSGNVFSDSCDDCHGTDGGYTFERLSVSSTTPRVIEPDTEFQHAVIISHPGKYKSTSITVELNLESAPDLLLDSEDTIQVGTMNSGTKTVTFNMKTADSTNSQTIRTVVTYYADHHYDPTHYTEILDITITIDTIRLSPSEWFVDLKVGEDKSITFSALDTIKNISVLPSSSLEKAVKIDHKAPTSLANGQKFTVQINAVSSGSGKLNVVFEDATGSPHKITMDIRIEQKTTEMGEDWVQVGIITGILSWIVLIIATIIGVPLKKLKSAFNKVFSTAVIRRKVHCGICYILLILALFHGVVVMGNHWSGAMLGDSFIFANPEMDYGLYINLGTISWFMMILVSVTGLFDKQIVKVIKHKNWRLTHSSITLIAFIIATIHVAVMLHFRFL